MLGSRHLLLPILTALAWLLLGVQIGHAADRFELRNSVSPHATAARWLRAADPDESLEMSVTLRLRHTDELAALLAAQQDPRSAEYRRWLTPDEFAARFAPSPEQYDVLVNWLHHEGFVVGARVNATRIDFTGPVGNVERTFGVRMNHYSHRGRGSLANENAPLLPAEFVGSVELIRLNTFPLAEPLVRIATPSGLVNTMAPRDIYIAYDMQALLDAGVNGAGQTVAVVARSDFNVGDVTTFQQQFDVPVRDPVKVFPSRNPGVGAPDGVCQDTRNQRQRDVCVESEEGEVLLDTEWAAAMAPGATVLVDISGTDIDASLMDIVTNHPEAKVITLSFGSCERLDSSDLTLFGPMYAQAAAQGQTVFVATGDDGADGCQDGRGRSINVLASDPNVTAVGGTSLDPGFDTNGNATRYVSETVWNDSGGASGGGVSTLVGKPAYQSAPGVPQDGFRDQPDVSLLASPATVGYVMIFEGSVVVTGGTSAGAPGWAGMVALLNDAMQVDGLGALNASLYTLGRRQYAENGRAVFHDVTRGGNSFNGVIGYNAGAGYDLASGLGTPDLAVLAQALDAMANPATPTATSMPTLTSVAPTPTPVGSPCVGDCDSSGDVTVSEILTLVGIAQGSTALSACPAGDANHDGTITVDEILTAVDNALNGCPPS